MSITLLNMKADVSVAPTTSTEAKQRLQARCIESGVINDQEMGTGATARDILSKVS